MESENKRNTQGKNEQCFLLMPPIPSLQSPFNLIDSANLSGKKTTFHCGINLFPEQAHRNLTHTHTGNGTNIILEIYSFVLIALLRPPYLLLFCTDFPVIHGHLSICMYTISISLSNS